MLRLEVNKIRSHNVATTGDTIARENLDIKSKLTKPELAPIKAHKVEGDRTNLNFNFMPYHDLEGFYHQMHPNHGTLPRAHTKEVSIEEDRGALLNTNQNMVKHKK